MKVKHPQIALLIALAMFLFSFNNKEKQVDEPNYTINGTIRGIQSDWIYLGHLDSSSKFIKIDSAYVNNEKFKFAGNVTQPEFCYLGLKPTQKNGKRYGIVFQGGFILDQGNLLISCHKDSLSKLVASGTKGQDQYRRFRQKANPLTNEMNSLYGKKLSAEKKKDKKLLTTLQAASQLNQAKMAQTVIDHIQQYPNSVVSAHIVRANLSNTAEANLQRAYNLLTDEAKNTPDGRWIYQKLLANNRTAVGQTAPYFEIPDVNGKLVSLNTFKGKMTLIDFWASWCGPCREENPNLVKAYETFKAKGFEIVSISMDGKKEDWLRAVKEDR